jgi:hypothetical protein
MHLSASQYRVAPRCKAGPLPGMQSEGEHQWAPNWVHLHTYTSQLLMSI